MAPVSTPRRLTRAAVVLALLVAPVLPLTVASASAADVPAGGATPSSLTLTGPADSPNREPGPPATLTVSPDPREGVEAGDTLTMTFTGLQPYEQLLNLGMCPTTAPAGTSITIEDSCRGRWPTGLPGELDATNNTPSLSTIKGSFPVYARADGTLTVPFIVGAGNSTGRFALDGGGTTEAPVACDSANPCQIGFRLGVNANFPTWSSLDVPEDRIVISPAPATVVDSGGCGAPGDTTLQVGGPERAQDVVADLNVGLCAGDGRTLPMDLRGQGEPDGLRALGETADLTFAGSGLLGSSAAPAATEGRVLTPVGLNAVVLAQIGGVEAKSNTINEQTNQPFSAGTPDPLPSIALSQSDVAKILVHGYPLDLPATGGTPDPPALYESILSHEPNAALREPFGSTVLGSRGALLPQAIAPTTVYPLGDDSTPATLSAQLQATAAADLVRPDLLPYRADEEAGTPSTVGEAVGPFTDFSKVADAGGKATRLTSNVGGIYTSIFGKDIGGGGDAVPCPSLNPDESPQNNTHTCGRFVVTDLVTATSLGLPVSSVQNASGAFVAPDAAGLQAAVAAGTTDESGLFTPALDAGGAAYPFTYVEYAVSQASPLLDESCAPRSAAQNSLNEVATYLANGGQSALADGLAPLTAPLVEQARASVARIGASPTSSGPCAPLSAAAVIQSAGTSSSALGGGSATGGAFGGGGGASALSNPAGLTGPIDPAAVQVPTAETTAAVEKAAATVDIPVFGQAGALGALGPLAGLVGLVGLTSGAGVLASNRLSGKSFADLRAWVHHTFVGDPVIQTVGKR